MNEEKLLSKLGYACLFIFVTLVFAMVSTYLAQQDIEQTIQNKFDRLPSHQTGLVKYDSVTQSKVDTIEARRAMSHRHVDNLYTGELQTLLDSLYNSTNQ